MKCWKAINMQYQNCWRFDEIERVSPRSQIEKHYEQPRRFAGQYGVDATFNLPQLVTQMLPAFKVAHKFMWLCLSRLLSSWDKYSSMLKTGCWLTVKTTIGICDDRFAEVSHRCVCSFLCGMWSSTLKYFYDDASPALPYYSPLIRYIFVVERCDHSSQRVLLNESSIVICKTGKTPSQARPSQAHSQKA